MEERDPLISKLWREAEHPLPPRGLDERILAAARQAVAQPKSRRRSWWRLAVPFSAAAVLVLAVTLLLRVEREAPGKLYDAAPSAVRQAPQMAEAETRAGEDRSGADLAAAKAPRDQARTDAPPAAFEGGGRAERSSPPAARPAAEPVPGSAASAAQEADRGVELADALAAQPPVAAPSRLQPAPHASGLELGQSKSEDADGGPEQTIERIRRLLGEGRREDALKTLAELRRRHPEFALPPDLRDLR